MCLQKSIWESESHQIRIQAREGEKTKQSAKPESKGRTSHSYGNSNLLEEEGHGHGSAPFKSNWEGRVSLDQLRCGEEVSSIPVKPTLRTENELKRELQTAFGLQQQSRTVCVRARITDFSAKDSLPVRRIS
ncbi:hypothetical protein ANO11243_032530 [Dothideomycetidae sp. 11243]|nr:hypothetical protein ANO11243_032530 [fungal sp. No.11243]